MTKKENRVSFHLDPGGIKSLPEEEILNILIAADPLIGSGGRTLLSKVLKGSKEKKIIELNLDKNPSYGFYNKSSLPLILNKIDWIILNNYLAVEYDYRLPLLIYEYDGWRIFKEYKINEILDKFERMIQSETSEYDMYFLKDMDRDLIFELLNRISGIDDNQKYIPLLKSWYNIDYKKVRNKIKGILNTIEKESKL